jgi:hypothetical protein
MVMWMADVPFQVSKEKLDSYSKMQTGAADTGSFEREHMHAQPR